MSCEIIVDTVTCPKCDSKQEVIYSSCTAHLGIPIKCAGCSNYFSLELEAINE